MSSGPPSLGLFLGEARVLAEWWAGRKYDYGLESRGDGGQIVLVIPGFLAFDWMTSVLRRVLTAAGYHAYGWGMGWNRGLRPGIIEGLMGRVETLARQGHGPIMIVGWSLGGLYAREVAKRMPERVARVITMGSPFSGDLRANRAWRLYERIAGHEVDHPPIEVDLHQKPPQPTIALWSARDGIVSPSCTHGLSGEVDAAIEVDCTHLGFVCAPAAIEAVLRALR